MTINENAIDHSVGEYYYTDASTLVSENLLWVGHNAATRTLFVQFRSDEDATYAYFDVAPEVFRELADASSAGRYYNVNVRGQYSGTQLLGYTGVFSQRVGEDSFKVGQEVVSPNQPVLNERFVGYADEVTVTPPDDGITVKVGAEINTDKLVITSDDFNFASLNTLSGFQVFTVKGTASSDDIHVGVTVEKRLFADSVSKAIQIVSNSLSEYGLEFKVKEVTQHFE